MADTFDVWVRSDQTGAFEPYTVRPFSTRAAAEEWVRLYIPNAETFVALNKEGE